MTKSIRMARVVLALVATAPILIFVVQFISRCNFPAHLEIMEGQNLFHSWRLAEGRALYVEPSIKAISPPYFPLYYHLVALLMKFAGPAWWTGRAVSFASALGVGLLFFALGRRESASRLWGLLIAGLFFGAYGLTGAYYDLFRVDSLPLFLGFAAMMAATGPAGPGGVVAASLLSVLAVLGKQTELAFVPVVALALLFRNRKHALCYLILTGTLLAAVLYGYNRQSEGWFWKYTVDMVGHHSIHQGHQKAFFTWAPRHFGIPLLAAVAYGLDLARRRKFRELFGEPWFYFLGASWLSSFLIYRIRGSYLNSLIPATMGLLAGLAVFGPRLYRSYRDRFPSRLAPYAPWIGVAALVAMLAMQGFPFALKHPLSRQVPGTQHKKAAASFNAYLRSQPGVIYIPFHTLPDNPHWYLPHNVPLKDLRGAPWGRPYHRKILADLEKQKIDTIIFKSRRKTPSRFRSLLADFDGPHRLPKEMRVNPGPLTVWPKAVYKRKG